MQKETQQDYLDDTVIVPLKTAKQRLIAKKFLESNSDMLICKSSVTFKAERC